MSTANILESSMIKRHFVLDRGSRGCGDSLPWNKLTQKLPDFIRDMNSDPSDCAIEVSFDSIRGPSDIRTGIPAVDTAAQVMLSLKDFSMSFELHGRDARASTKNGEVTLTSAVVEVHFTDEWVTSANCGEVTITSDGTVIVKTL